MAKRVTSPSASFTTQLLPAAKAAPDSQAANGLTPIHQRWLLALMHHFRKTNYLLDHGSLRKLLGVGDPAYWESHRHEPIVYDDDTEDSDKADKRRESRRVDEWLREAHAIAHTRSPDFSHPIFVNMERLGELVGLNATEKVVLSVIILLRHEFELNQALSALSIRVSNEDKVAEALAVMTDCDPEALRNALRKNGTLRRLELIKMEKDAEDIERYFGLPRGLAHLMIQHHSSAEPLIAHFLLPRGDTTLQTSHFPHLADEISIVTGILREALRLRVTGTNILFYGPPGVGKTELASVVAQMLQAHLYEVGYADEDGDPIRGTERLAAYALCQRLLSRRADAIVLFDEVEDMLEDGETPGKAWVNRTLEENPVPAIWITNNAQVMDSAYRRRFDYSVEVVTPPRAVRQEIARHHLQGITTPADGDAEKASLDNDWLAALAENPALTPAQMERAAKVAKLVEVENLQAGNTAAAQRRVIQVLERSTHLLGQPKPRIGRTMATAYDLAYLNTDVAAPVLVEALRHNPQGSFCFYGPPGAGKTALARHIAQELELPVILRRASDLLDCYLGGTEKRIAEMFEVARIEPSVLILDEADSFLQSRANARHSWEVQQVNEFLTQMEEYEGLFICTTNLLDKLDPASLRRFDWKVAFRPLNASQRWALFLQEFHLMGGEMSAAMPLQTSVRQQLEGITPGDFAPVARQYRLLRRTPTASELMERLRAELAAKNGHGGSSLHTNHWIVANANRQAA